MLSTAALLGTVPLHTCSGEPKRPARRPLPEHVYFSTHCVKGATRALPRNGISAALRQTEHLKHAGRRQRRPVRCSRVGAVRAAHGCPRGVTESMRSVGATSTPRGMGLCICREIGQLGCRRRTQRGADQGEAAGLLPTCGSRVSLQQQRRRSSTCLTTGSSGQSTPGPLAQPAVQHQLLLHLHPRCCISTPTAQTAVARHVSALTLCQHTKRFHSNPRKGPAPGTALGVPPPLGGPPRGCGMRVSESRLPSCTCRPRASTA